MNWLSNKLFYTIGITLLCGGLHAQSLAEAKKLYNEGKYAEAKPAFEKLVKQAPSNSSYNHWYGVCCYETGDLTGAEKHLKVAVKRKVQEAYRYMSEVYYKTYRFDQAGEMLEEYINLLAKKKQDPQAFEAKLDLANNAQRMMEKVEDISLVFFLPLFFAFTGLRTEIGLINSPELWMVCLLLVTVAIVGKLGGCAIAARLVGESWKDSLTVGTLMNTRGLMELVALNIGYEMGVLPPSIFVILVIMALVTTFMTTPLLHLVERFFVHREEKLSLKRKLIFCFGRPESGRSLLSIYDLLFGKQLKKEHVIAAHYTVGTDLNPLDAQHYESESFALLNQRAVELNIQVDNHYRVTDKLVQEMIHFIRKEHPDMLLLGAGSHYRPEMPGTPGAILWLTLFRDKIDDIMEQVKCPVAVFVNRSYREGALVSFVLGGMIDVFLLSYLNIMLQNGHSVRLFLFETDDEEFHQCIDDLLAHYADQIVVVWFAGVEELVTKEKDGLLVMSHLSYTKLSEDELVMRELSSLLVIRRNKNKGEKNERLEIG